MYEIGESGRGDEEERGRWGFLSSPPGRISLSSSTRVYHPPCCLHAETRLFQGGPNEEEEGKE